MSAPRLYEDEWLVRVLADHLLGVLQPVSESASADEDMLSLELAEAALGFLDGVLMSRAATDAKGSSAP